MEEDFPTSPSKRRRTMSPEDPAFAASSQMPAAQSMADSRPSDTAMPVEEKVSEVEHTGANSTVFQPQSEGGLLDILMAQVEAQSRDAAPSSSFEAPQKQLAQIDDSETQQLLSEDSKGIQQEQTMAQDEHKLESTIPGTAAESTVEYTTESTIKVQDTLNHQQNEEMAFQGRAAAEKVRENLQTEDIKMDSVNASAELEDDAVADVHHTEQEIQPDQSMANGVEQSIIVPSSTSESAGLPPATERLSEPPAPREWETDSSPYSSDSDSSDVSSTSEDDSEEDADNDYALLSPSEQARILMDDGGSDDEGGKSKPTGTGLKTANEKTEEVIPKPDIVVTENMKIEELGSVEAVVENTVLIKAKTTGEYQILESGSLLCLQDRSVIGVIAEPLGRVEQPLYTVRFTNDEAIVEAGVMEMGKKVYYVPQHSTFVFTQPLKGLKGSDASNFHDEEVGDDEMEFSDDEKEAEHRRMLKNRKRGIPDDGAGRSGRGGGRGGQRGRGGRGRGGRGGYQPSLLPQFETNTTGPATLDYDEGEIADYTPQRRPILQEDIPASWPQQSQSSNPPEQNGHTQNRPAARPQLSGYQQRSRGAFQQNQNQNRPPTYQPTPQQQPYAYQPQQQQASWMPPPPPPNMANWSNPFANFQQFQQQFPQHGLQGFGQQQNGYTQQQQNGYSQQQHSYNNAQQPQPNYNGQWATNQAAAQQTARQLEELRRQQQQNNQGQGQGGPGY